MSKLLFLYKGENQRMLKYGITGASLAAALLWVVLLHFGNFANISVVFPFVLFLDATLMSLLLAGVTIIFESQENVLKSFLVLPITRDDYLIAKTLAVITSSLLTLVLLLVYGFAFHSLSLHVPGLFLAITLIAFVFAQLGILMTYYSKDFTDLLMGMFKFAIIFTLPTFLEFVGVLNAPWIRLIQYLNPTKNAMVLLQATAVPVDTSDVLIAVAMLLVIGASLFLAARKLFDQFAMRGGGA